MFETHICVVGNVLTAPEWRRTSASGRLVTTFKVAAATRRLDRATGAWVDGNGLRVRVSCWRDLAGGVASSIMVGDPVIVYGQIYTRDWVDSDGTKRTLYEMQALAVGHNLARGRARFARNKPVSASEVEPDPTEPVRLDGETTERAFGLPTGLDPSDPLRQLDDAAFDEALTFDEAFTNLNEGGPNVGSLLDGGLVEGDGRPAPWGSADLLRFAAGPSPEEAGDGSPEAADGSPDEAGGASPDEAADAEGEDDDLDADEDVDNEESADDATAVGHRTQEEADGTTAPKSRRRRRTPAGV